MGEIFSQVKGTQAWEFSHSALLHALVKMMIPLLNHCRGNIHSSQRHTSASSHIVHWWRDLLTPSRSSSGKNFHSSQRYRGKRVLSFCPPPAATKHPSLSKFSHSVLHWWINFITLEIVGEISTQVKDTQTGEFSHSALHWWLDWFITTYWMVVMKLHCLLNNQNIMLLWRPFHSLTPTLGKVVLGVVLVSHSLISIHVKLGGDGMRSLFTSQCPFPSDFSSFNYDCVYKSFSQPITSSRSIIDGSTYRCISKPCVPTTVSAVNDITLAVLATI